MFLKSGLMGLNLALVFVFVYGQIFAFSWGFVQCLLLAVLYVFCSWPCCFGLWWTEFHFFCFFFFFSFVITSNKSVVEKKNDLSFHCKTILHFFDLSTEQSLDFCVLRSNIF
jgi:hypothetical protein